MTTETPAGRRDFPGLHYSAFQHPADREALNALRQVPALPEFLRWVNRQWGDERRIRVMCLANYIKLGPRQSPRIYALLEEAAHRLDVQELPSLYLSSSNTVNAQTLGVAQFHMVLDAGLVDLMSEDELLAVIGHELTHVKCEHGLYRMLSFILTEVAGSIANAVPVLGSLQRLVTAPLVLTLFDWIRKSELSCDRGSLLVVQDPATAARALVKLAGGSSSPLVELNDEVALEQANELTDVLEDSTLTNLMYLLRKAYHTHPDAMYRVKEVHRWSDSPQYADILAGKYATDAPTGPLGQSRGRTIECPECGRRTTLRPGHRFCSGCGAELRKAD